MINSDNRKRVTKQIIKDSFINLLLEENIKNITVKELCYEAKINRSTFYAHYEDIYNVLQEIEKDMYEELNKTINQDLFKNNDSVYYSVFNFFFKHQQMCRILLSNNSGSDFVERALELGRNKFTLVYHNFNQKSNENYLNYFYSYVSNGIIGLLKKWFDNNMRESITEISTIAEKLVLEGIKFIL